MSSAPNPPLFARGACMECRRLKTKCDRAVPCAPCKRRGCESICPSGLRARGSRNPTAEVEQLNRNIQSMTARIRQLEEALQQAQTQASSVGIPSPPSGPFVSHSDPPTPEFSSITRRPSQPNDQSRNRILSMLPGETVAWNLVDLYYENHGWLVQPISRTHLVNVMKRAYSVPCAASNSEISTILAIFSLTASSAHGPWMSSAQFYELSMSALRLNDVLAETDLSTIEAMTLQCAYLYLASESDNIRRAWNYIGITIRMAYGMGLHRDPKIIGLTDEECTRRRRLFHELVTLDIWQSMVIQRPPCFQASLFSTEMPFDSVESLGNDPTFFHWKHAFCHQGVVPLITEVTCAVTPPPYTTVLEVDKRIRSSPVPVALQLTDFKTAPMDRLLQSQQMMVMTELALIKLHKEYFIRAIEEDPQDPMKNYAAHSVTTVIESASSLLKRLRTIAVDCDRIIPRLNCPWESAVAALSYLSLFIRRVSDVAMVKPLYIEFEMGCKLVADHASDTGRVSKLMPHVVELRRTVHEAAPQLMEDLRRVLSERKKREVVTTVPPPALALEYPLGPPPVDTSFPPLYPSVNSNALLDYQQISGLFVPSDGNEYQAFTGHQAGNTGYGPGHFDPYLSLAVTDFNVSGLGNYSSKGSSDSHEGSSFLYDRPPSMVVDGDFAHPPGHYAPSFL